MLPFTVGIRDSVVQLVSTLGSVASLPFTRSLARSFPEAWGVARSPHPNRVPQPNISCRLALPVR